MDALRAADRLSLSTDNDWMRRARRVDARASTRRDILTEIGTDATVYPRFVSRMKGAHLWDTDGNRYVDYMLGYGPVILGHADERVNEAVIAELAHGNCMAPLWSSRQIELNELLCEVLPGAEQAYLMKTGSDTTTAAVRLARIHTGRSRVIRWGYNGWHDWAAGSPNGIPPESYALTSTFDHSDPDSLRQAFATYPGEVACVLIMPFEEGTTTTAHLAELKSITHEHGAVFIFDEMRSGFRMAVGGAQEYFGVQADLATFSKAMANGYPISALCGRRDIMSGLALTRISSTFYASPVEMAAAMATIDVLRHTDALARVWRLGGALQHGLRRLIADYEVAAEVVGYAPMPFLRFTDADPQRRDEVRNRFYVTAVAGGALLHPDHQWFVSAAHTDDDIQATLDVCRVAMERAVG
ncbi:aspartate aminotransferase family protein [Streptomyces sp. NRRL S-1824]|uniref:aspartate aminotransferase family protein n=1 Tax=Streptomyces sp. NRRL S-1824 TaxID=1463889 RepID=UPI0004CBAB79|nr:aminotransferase class III-fold pyridoxal phosphate-dependent enzyme [Streptomyces sp. NRRL S-1824]